MLFNSAEFGIYFLVVTSLYFILPHKNRWLMLLLSSCYFYMAFVPVYILILGGTIVVDYFAGILIEQSVGHRRKVLLVASLVANIGVLAVFKYYNFLNDNLTQLLGSFTIHNPIPGLSILLPIGLSFHTFQAMSYTIEVYRGNQKAERHFGIYALYVMFYPQLVAGPIERPQNLLHQFREEHAFDYDRVTDGLKLMAWGLFKKVVIADRLAMIVDSVYDSPHEHQGASFIVATVMFSYQVYCDFSGYSDMAIGAAQVMGFSLMKNFDRPYHSRSISEFWSRWHISLSTWFKDYLYISLGGNRVSIPRWYINLIIVFLVSGLWHGANWTYLFWGFLHSSYMVLGIFTRNARKNIADSIGLTKIPRIYSALQICSTFSLVTLAWVFFRAKTVEDAFYIIKNSMSFNLDIVASRNQLMQAVGVIVFMEIIHLMQYKFRIRDWIAQRPIALRWSIYYLGLAVIVFFGKFNNKQFIYFQF